MAAEGEFPKAGGDIAYASEANRFASSVRTIGDVTIPSVGSSNQSNEHDLGSVILGSAWPNPSLFSIKWGDITSTNGSPSLSVEISGTTSNNQVTLLPESVFTTVLGKSDIILGSPLRGWVISQYQDIGGGVTQERASRTLIQNFDTTQNMVMTFKLYHQNTGSNQSGGTILVTAGGPNY